MSSIMAMSMHHKRVASAPKERRLLHKRPREARATERSFATVGRSPAIQFRRRRRMHRYATAPRATFEELFEHARSGVYKVDEATYPPACGGRSGDVSLSLGRSGAMIVHVEPGACGAEEFRMKLLFETGTGVFSTPEELWRFWTGPLAASFGITTAEPGDQPELPAEEPDLEQRVQDMVDAHDDVRLEMDSGTTMPAGQPFSRLTSAALATELRRVIHGQDAALERVPTTAVAQLRKRHPARPGSV